MLKFFRFCQQPWQPGNRLGILAEFKDKAEESHVESFLNIDNAFWIGLNDIQGEGFPKKNEFAYHSNIFLQYMQHPPRAIDRFMTGALNTKFMDRATQFYQAGDNVWKEYAYVWNRNNLNNIFKGNKILLL